jgi:SulP family sulfate permease
VTTGFTTGIAVIIATSQVKDVLGLRMGAVPAEFVEKWSAFAEHIGTVNVAAAGVTALALAILIFWPRVSHRIPAPLVALLASTALVHLAGLPVETIGSRFGAISASLPHPVIPHLSFTQITALVAPAFTIALLGGIESLLSAVVADGMIGAKHRSNMELVGQGVANIGSALFGGIPATGAIARTATNVKNGGRTPVAGIVHSVTLLVITLFFGKWASLVPLAALGAILLVVAYHMSEWRVFRAELSSPRGDVAVLLVTFGLTVLVDLTVAIEVGMVLAAFLFLKKMSEVTSVTAMGAGATFEDEEEEVDDPDATGRYRIPRGVEVYEIDGPFFFGAAAAFKDTLTRIAGKPKVLILRMRKVPTIDATGLHTLLDVVHRSRADGTLVLLSGVQPQPREAILRSAIVDEIGEENLCPTFAVALERAREEMEARRLLHGTGSAPAVTTAGHAAAEDEERTAKR